ncbi:MAG: RidA family protein [Myxococcales bacterium]|nr:RidA family protein [Myxococcales bacterium]
MSGTVIQPPGWPPARGYANGIVATGRVLAIAGQVGWTPAGVFEAKDLLGQFDQALANVRAVLDAAGGQPEDVIRMTIYVTDLPAYRAGVKGLGPIWRRHFGRHYPAMALVGVTGLVEPEALVEIETTAVLPEETP